MFITNLCRREPVKTCQQLLPLGSCSAWGAVSMLLGGFVVCATCPGFDAALPGKWHFQIHFGVVFKILNTCIKSRGSDKEPGRPDWNWPDSSCQEPRKARASLAFGGQTHMSCLCCAGLDAFLTFSKMSLCILPMLLQSKSSLWLGFAHSHQAHAGWKGLGVAARRREGRDVSCPFRACSPFSETVRFEITCSALYK